MLKFKQITNTCIDIVKNDEDRHSDSLWLDEKWTFGAEECTSKELRQIADKLDELNEVIK